MAREYKDSANREHSYAGINYAEEQPVLERKLKDSCIEWIGEIPSYWEIMPHKRLMKKIKNICSEYNGEDIISLTMNGVIVRDLNAGGKMPTSFDGYQYVYPGNLLMCLFDIDVTPRCVGLIKNEGLTSPAYSQFALFDGAYAPYYNYLLKYMDDEKCILHLSKNLRSSLTEEDFGQIPTILPPFDEQKQIASFLDKTSGEIDKLVSLQEQMIEELKAYKQSVITEAVIKGLNPDAPMKDSGIDWIGNVPKTWNVYRFKSYISLAKEKVDDINLPKINLENIESYSGKFIETNSKYEGEGYLFKPGDVLFGKLRPYLAKVFAPNYKGQAVGDFYVFRPSSKIKTNFLKYAILSDSFISNVNSSTYGIKMPRANWNYISNVYIAVPSENEQHTIASYLDTKSAEIDSLIDMKQQKIESLKEYKKSIIFEYVTGKKQVV